MILATSNKREELKVKLISGEERQSNTFEVKKMLVLMMMMMMMTVIMMLMMTSLGNGKRRTDFRLTFYWEDFPIPT